LAKRTSTTDVTKMKVTRPNCPYIGVFKVAGLSVGIYVTQKQHDAWHANPREFTTTVNFSHMIRATLSRKFNRSIEQNWLVQNSHLVEFAERFPKEPIVTPQASDTSETAVDDQQTLF